jgi:Flp pilus assembly protein TadG
MKSIAAESMKGKESKKESKLLAPVHNASENTRCARKRTHRERGSTVIEFAVVSVLVLFPLLFGIVDFARAAYAYHGICLAAREASRWASVRGSECANSLPAPCEATSGAGGSVDSYVRANSSPGIYVDSSSCSATAGCLLVTTSWPGPPPGTAASSACTGGAGSNSPGCAVSVEVQYTFGFDLPFLPQAAINMSSTSQAVISQ